jgi:hypothetical protein
MSLDGYIADSNHSADWIVRDPDIDFGEMFARFDTFLMGSAYIRIHGAPRPGKYSGKGSCGVFAHAAAK